eukprot:CAMPEP_0206630760 /NCGR_PEP_ID=MMETSP0325_2-20121206/67758_1 /ASSEMBLY_ACC=CAM_ASM_000347 /TAXON_ID=2866 /ORGANISM="Crypthecodinium cohnii, Strain Seligo" /LENGTH=156 /DNA_ID=CAMNT_0054155667 /DNA_START=203 /DNA_END=670 /DNA_ORIENTATION=+
MRVVPGYLRTTGFANFLVAILNAGSPAVSAGSSQANLASSSSPATDVEATKGDGDNIEPGPEQPKQQISAEGDLRQIGETPKIFENGYENQVGDDQARNREAGSAANDNDNTHKHSSNNNNTSSNSNNNNTSSNSNSSSPSGIDAQDVERESKQQQ